MPSRDVENGPGCPPAAARRRIAASVERAGDTVGRGDAFGLQSVDRRRETRRALVCTIFESLHSEAIEALPL